MIVVDSSVWIDLFNDVRSDAVHRLDELLGTEAVALGDVILTEVLQGFRSDLDYHRTKEALLTFPVFPMLGIAQAISSADNYRLLRRHGLTVRKSADVVIASYCIDHGHSLLFSDRDFLPFVDHLGLEGA